MWKHARANKPTRRVTTIPAGVPHRGHDVAGLSYPVSQAEQTISVKIFRARRADHLPAGPVMQALKVSGTDKCVHESSMTMVAASKLAVCQSKTILARLGLCFSRGS
jgi:hypothetical protein